MLHGVARLAIAAPRRVIIAALLLMIAVGAFGVPVAQKLSPSGFQDPTAHSSRVADILTEKFGQGDVPLVIVVTAAEGYDSPQARAVATDVIDQLTRSGHVSAVTSAWTSPAAAASAMVCADKT